MKKKNFKALKLNKNSISKLQLSHVKGGISLGCGDNTTTLRTNWLGCGATDNCHGTGSYFCATSAAVCDHICPSDV